MTSEGHGTDDIDTIRKFLASGHSISETARLTGAGKSKVYRTKVQWLAEEARRLAQQDWEMDPETIWLLGLDLPQPDPLEADACWEWASELTERFMAFELTFIPMAKHQPYIRKAFHRQWITEILFAYATGGYLQIMSPPRHGKTELLRNFCVWLVCRDPDIRILYISSTEPIAVNQVRAVRDILTNYTTLIEAVLGPWEKFKSSNWSVGEFTVANRTAVLSGSTMLAVGRGGRILSLNADMIVVDDIEDFESTVLPNQRRKTRRYFNQDIDSRKEEHTCLVCIGSRQHIDDLWGYNLKDPNFRTIVNSAHDPDCDLDPEDIKAHVDCMLFPELRSYRWLKSKEVGGEAREAEGIFEMVYLNDPHDHDYQIFTKSVVEPTFNPNRGIGLEGIPLKRRKLIAGLDPSATGYQAGFLWAVTPSTRATSDVTVRGPDGEEVVVPTLRHLSSQDSALRRWMVDIENRKGGGIEEALRLMETWWEMYGCDWWVVEENMYHGSIKNDPRVKHFCRINDIHLETIQTVGTNKNDPRYGVGAMQRLYAEHVIDLPYGTPSAKAKVKSLTRELYAFTDDLERRTKTTSNILMASWFPQRTIRRWEKELVAESEEVVVENPSPYPRSYPNVTGFSGYTEAPWR